MYNKTFQLLNNHRRTKITGSSRPCRDNICCHLQKSSTPNLIALCENTEISYEICIANVNGGSLVEVGMPNQIRSHPSCGTRIGQNIIILYLYE